MEEDGKQNFTNQSKDQHRAEYLIIVTKLKKIH